MESLKRHYKNQWHPNLLPFDHLLFHFDTNNFLQNSQFNSGIFNVWLICLLFLPYSHNVRSLTRSRSHTLTHSCKIKFSRRLLMPSITLEITVQNKWLEMRQKRTTNNDMKKRWKKMEMKYRAQYTNDFGDLWFFFRWIWADFVRPCVNSEKKKRGDLIDCVGKGGTRDWKKRMRFFFLSSMMMKNLLDDAFIRMSIQCKILYAYRT